MTEYRTSNDCLETALLACARVLSEDADIAVTGLTPDASTGNTDKHTAWYADPRTRRRHRAQIDAAALMHRFHDSAAFRSAVPADRTAARLLAMLERERVEALGGRLFAGVAANLNQLWLTLHTPAVDVRLDCIEQLEWVLSALCRDRFGMPRLPPALDGLLETLRSPIERRISADIRELSTCLHDQACYSACSQRLIERLGYSCESAVSAIQPPESGTPADADAKEAKPSGAPAEDASVRAIDDTARVDAASVDGAIADQTEVDADARGSAACEEAVIDVLVRNPSPQDGSELEHDALDHVSNSATNRASVASSSSSIRKPWKAFAKDADELVRAATLVDARALRGLRSRLDAVIAEQGDVIQRLGSRLQRVVLTTDRREWLFEQAEGELDTRRLTRIITDPNQALAFRTETDSVARNTAVSILIDNSRSMLGRPIEIAAACADILARSLERCGVVSEVLGFTTVSMYGGVLKTRWQRAGEPYNAGRLNGVRHIIYKPATASWRSVRQAFGVMLEPDILKQNIDGDALTWAHQRLLARPEQRRILIVISDGAPSDAATLAGNDKDLLVRQLKHIAHGIEERSPVELLAIGIGHDVGTYYRHALSIRSADELTPVLVHELTRLLAPATRQCR